MARPTTEEILEKYEGEGYPIHVVGRHIEITAAMRSYAVDKLKKAKRFGGRLSDATITMDVQKLVHTVDFNLHINNTRVKVSGASENMYAAVDEAIAHLERRLRRYMQRLHEHNSRPLKEVDMQVHVLESSPLDDINDEIEEARLAAQEAHLGKIISSEKMPLKTLTQAEAVLKMELSQDQFLLYRAEEDRKLKLIYRRRDGHFNLIHPE